MSWLFFAVAFQPLPHLLKSDETYLLNCVYVTVKSTSRPFFALLFFRSSFFSLLFHSELRIHVVGLAGFGLNVISTD